MCAPASRAVLEDPQVLIGFVSELPEASAYIDAVQPPVLPVEEGGEGRAGVRSLAVVDEQQGTGPQADAAGDLGQLAYLPDGAQHRVGLCVHAPDPAQQVDAHF